MHFLRVSKCFQHVDSKHMYCAHSRGGSRLMMVLCSGRSVIDAELEAVRCKSEDWGLKKSSAKDTPSFLSCFQDKRLTVRSSSGATSPTASPTLAPLPEAGGSVAGGVPLDAMFSLADDGPGGGAAAEGDAPVRATS